MGYINDYLKQYRNLTTPNESIRKAAQRVIKEVCGITISFQNISYKNSTISLTLKPAERARIYTKRSEIIEKLNQETNIYIRDVR